MLYYLSYCNNPLQLKIAKQPLSHDQGSIYIIDYVRVLSTKAKYVYINGN